MSDMKVFACRERLQMKKLGVWHIALLCHSPLVMREDEYESKAFQGVLLAVFALTIWLLLHTYRIIVVVGMTKTFYERNVTKKQKRLVTLTTYLQHFGKFLNLFLESMRLR